MTERLRVAVEATTIVLGAIAILALVAIVSFIERLEDRC